MKGGCKKEKFLVWFHQIFIHVKNCCNCSNAHKATTKSKKPKKGNSDPNGKKQLARLPHKPPEQTNPDLNTREKRQNQTKRPTEKKRVVERERGKSSLRADPPRPPPARHFHFKQDYVCFSFSCPRSKKKKMSDSVLRTVPQPAPFFEYKKTPSLRGSKRNMFKVTKCDLKKARRSLRNSRALNSN